MLIKCCDFDTLAKKVKRDNVRVLLFGAGAIGQVSAPEILNSYGILDYADCYLDNGKSLWGTYVNACGRQIEIKSPDYLYECGKNALILLNISRFSDAIAQLEAMPCTKDMECYLMPMLLIHNFCSKPSEGGGILSDRALIPKKLHYMWMGKKTIPDNLKKCMETWRRYCPDYEIIEWNEDNYDVEKHFYMKQAYENGAYGFIADYGRLDILYNEGGFYLDTDVEIKRSLEDLRYQHAFCGVEKWQIVNFGGLCGAVKGHGMIKSILDFRSAISFYNEDGSLNKNTCGFYDTRAALQKGYVLNGKTQNVCGMNIYAYDYFHPFDYMSGILNETENTYSVHWFNGGWLDESMKRVNEDSKRLYLGLYRQAMES